MGRWSAAISARRRVCVSCRARAWPLASVSSAAPTRPYSPRAGVSACRACAVTMARDLQLECLSSEPPACSAEAKRRRTIGHGCALLAWRPARGYACRRAQTEGAGLPNAAKCVLEDAAPGRPANVFSIPTSPLTVGCSTPGNLTPGGRRRPPALEVCGTPRQSLPSPSRSRRPRVHPRRRGERMIV